MTNTTRPPLKARELHMPDYSSRANPLTIGAIRIMIDGLDDHIAVRAFDGGFLEHLEDEEPVHDEAGRAVLLPFS